MEKIFFDSAAYNHEVGEYSSGIVAMEGIVKRYIESGISATLTIDDIASIALNKFDDLRKRYIAEELKASGKSPVMKRYIEAESNATFNKWEQNEKSRESRGKLGLAYLDLSLIVKDGDRLKFVGHEAIKAKHTYAVESEKQKRAVDLMQRMLEAQSELKAIVGETSILGFDGCFYDDGGELQTDWSIIKQLR